MFSDHFMAKAYGGKMPSALYLLTDVKTYMEIEQQVHRQL